MSKKRLTLSNPTSYEIIVQGKLDPSWSSWFDTMAMKTADDGNTILIGTVADQAALQGILTKLYALGLLLIRVQCIQDELDNE